MKTMIKILVSFMTVLTFTVSTFAQTSFSGRVVDAETNEPIPGVSVLQKGTANGVATNIDGKFELSLQGKGKLVLSSIGYTDRELDFNANAGKTNLGSISLSADTQLLGEVVVIGSGVVDLAQNRKTPIAVSTIKTATIAEKVGSSDLPELLKSTPSVQSVQRGGFGDGRMYLRGFDQTNTAFLLNGQPINGMEDGKMYWSNWTGVLDIANAVEVQRGLGSSKLAISSVGGTVNIVTKTVDKKKGGFVKTMFGNDNYIKATGYYSSGLMSNGFAVSAMFGHWQGDGYMQGAKGQGQTYFLSLGYKPNDNHIFNFLLTGAPQWHGAAGGSRLSDYLEKGRRYSNWWGYKDQKLYSGGRNYYHKPIMNLSWDWTLSEKTKLSTVAYGSYGRGGFAYPEADYSQSKGKRFYDFRDADGLLDYDKIEQYNIDAGASNFVKGSVNSHNWYGMVSNIEYKLNENLNLNLGVDTRFYNGVHYRSAVDLLGGTKSVKNKLNGTYTITKDTGFNPWKNTFTSVDKKQRYKYDYEENINYIGAFGQLEYATDIFSAFFQGAVSNQSHLKTDSWNYDTEKESEKVTNLGYNLKTGASFRLNDNNILFGNIGFYSRQPFHDDLFTNIRKSNELNKFGNKNQDITGLEFGYKFKSEYISANLNLYHTTWANRILSSARDTDKDGISDIFYQSSGVKEVHKGLELEVFTRPFSNFTLDGFASFGDWTYDGNVETKTFDRDDNLLSSGDIAYINGVKIGNAAQFTAGAKAKLKMTDNLSIDANYNYYNNLHAEIDLGAKEYEKKDNRGSIKLPSYNTVDAGLSFEEAISKDGKTKIKLRLNVNNIFDEFYIENSKDNIFAKPSDETWKGVNVKNRVYIGYGRTWNFAVTLKF